MELIGIWILVLFLLIGFIGVFFGIFGTLIILVSAIIYAIGDKFHALTLNFIILLL